MNPFLPFTAEVLFFLVWFELNALAGVPSSWLKVAG
jgi:hypothetical protein